MTRFIFSLISVLLITLAATPKAQADAPLAPTTFEIIQTSGYQFKAITKGNRHLQWYEIIATGEPIGKANDGHWYYLQLVNNKAALSAIKVGQLSTKQRSKIATSHQLEVLANKAQQTSANTLKKRPLPLPPLAKPNSKSTKLQTINQKVIVIAAQYNDQKLTHTAEQLNQLIFASEQSVHSYFAASSLNHMHLLPATESQGTQNDGVIIIDVDSNHPNQNTLDNSNIAAIYQQAAPFIALDSFDNNDNGRVSPDELLVLVVVAGYEAAYGGSVLSPKVWANTQNSMQLLTNTYADTVTIIGEQHALSEQATHLATRGIIAYELALQRFSLPELPITATGGVGQWGLMSTGLWNANNGEHLGQSPADLSAFNKTIANFAQPNVVTATEKLEIPPSNTANNYHKLWIDTYRHHEYFLLANRQQSGQDSALPGQGLLITHVDKRHLNENNNLGPVSIEAADGSFISGDSGDTFPGTSNANTFNATSNPNSNDNNNNSTGIALTGISQDGDNIIIEQATARAVGANIKYYLANSSGRALGLENTETYTALVVANNTQMNTLAGIDVRLEASGTADFYLYEAIENGLLTNQLHMQTNYDVTQGWNRLVFNQKQVFEPGQSRVLVLKLTTPASTSPVWIVDNSQGQSGNSFFIRALNQFVIQYEDIDLAQAALLEYSDTTDTDGDNIFDALDNCPTVSNPRQINTDGANDGGDACDNDDDNDGVTDNLDALPLDASEQHDHDQDGIGDNADNDDDNDGMFDSWENLNGLDPLNGGDASADNDNDGYTNLEEFLARSDPNDANSTPQSTSTTPGSIEWFYQADDSTDNRIIHPVAISDNGTTYLVSGSTLIALNQNGEKLWQVAAPGDQSIISAPSIGPDGSIYIAANNTLMALNPNGSEQWRYVSESGLALSAAPSINHQGELFVITNQNLLGLTSNGQLRWSYPYFAANHVQPVIAPDNHIIFGYDNQLISLDNNGQLKWRQQLANNITQNLSVNNSGIIHAVSGKQITAISMDSTIQWQIDLSDDIIASLSMGKNSDSIDNLYATTTANQLIAINPQGQSQWTYTNNTQLASNLGAVAIAQNGTIYLPTEQGTIKALNSQGQLLWQHQPSSQLTNPVMLDANGSLYIASQDNTLYRLFDANQGPASNQWSMTGGNARHNNAQGDGSNAPTTHPQSIDFETGDLSQGQFYLAGEHNWHITTSNTQQGGYSLTAPQLLGDNQQASLTLNAQTDAGFIEFYFSVSSEQDGDFFEFYLDGQLMKAFDGRVSWRQDRYFVEAGSHQLKWVYKKDGSFSNWEDTAWIDDIRLPNANVSDQDGDGIDDRQDNCPTVANRDQLNSDNSDDGGDACDSDDDNDGFADSNDAFPTDSSEWLDSDQDGIGNNLDFDDDNDGLADSWEITHGFDPLNNIDGAQDADNDGYTNFQEYLASSDPNDANSIPNANIGTGNIAFTAPSAIYSSAALAPNGDIVFGSEDGTLYALRYGQDNQLFERWQYKTDAAISLAPSIGADGSIYFAAANHVLYALDAEGSLQWQLSFDNTIYGPAIDATGNLVVSVALDGIYNISPFGFVQWQHANASISQVTPTLDANGNTYIGLQSGLFYSIDNFGNINWQYGLIHSINTSAVLDAIGQIYVSNNAGSLVKLSANGERIWQLELPSEHIHPPIIGHNGSLYFIDNNHILYAYSSDKKALWQYPLADPLSNYSTLPTSPTLGADGNIYVSGRDQHLYALTQHGQLIWRYKTDDEHFTSPLISNNTILFGGHSGQLQQVQITSAGLADSPWPMLGQNPRHTNAINIADQDGDGIIDSLDNCIAVANPNQTNTDGANDGGDACDSDDDNDQLPDTWELAYGSNPLIADAQQDTDNDGFSNFNEFNAGTDPTSAVSNPNGSGARLWQQAITASPQASPAIDNNGNLYLGSLDGNLYAFDTNGQILWQYQTDDRITASPSIGMDGTIYVGSEDYYLYAINPDGSLKWRFETNDIITSAPAISTEGIIYIGSNDGYLYALNTDGQRQWQFFSDDIIESSPAIDSEGNLYFADSFGYFYALTPAGTLKWRYSAPTEGIANTSLDSDNNVYFTADTGLYQFNPAGQLQWTFSNNDSFSASPAIASTSSYYPAIEGSIYLGSLSGVLYVLNNQGQQQWQYPTGSSITATPLLSANGNIILPTVEGLVYVIDKNGQVQWRSWANGGINASANIAYDGSLYVVNQQGTLQAMRSNQSLASGPWPMQQANRNHSGQVTKEQTPSIQPWVNFILQLQFDE